MIDLVMEETTEKMEKAVTGIRHELAGIRTGKASPGLLEGIQVDAYESKMPLNQLSTISSPEPRLLLVQPWDKTLIGAISKAIQSSDLGLTPSSDGNVVRVPIPQLNEERRKDLVRLVHKVVETGRVSIRHARKEANDELTKLNFSYEHLAMQYKRDKEKMEHLARALEEANEKLRDLAFRDELTGLFNQRHFFMSLDNELHRAVRYARPFSLILMDRLLKPALHY